MKATMNLAFKSVFRGACLMKKRYALLLVFGLIPMAASSPAFGQTFTTLDYPGALGTGAAGVSGATVVGNYQSSTNNDTHGFIYNGSTFVTLNVPGATDTRVGGISGNPRQSLQTSNDLLDRLRFVPGPKPAPIHLGRVESTNARTT